MTNWGLKQFILLQLAIFPITLLFVYFLPVRQPSNLNTGSSAPGVSGTDGINGQDGIEGDGGLAGSAGSDGLSGDDGTEGTPGDDGTEGLSGSDGLAGAPGQDGDPATDDQLLSFDGTNLGLVNGGTVYLGQFYDNTDAQTLALNSNSLSISNGNNIDLSSYLDNTDSQNLSLDGNTLSLQSGGSVNLSGYLDNTDTLADLSCSANQVAKVIASTWTCADVVTADSLDFSDFSDSLSLDATTALAYGSSNFVQNLDGSGDFIIQDAGSDIFTVSDSGTFLLRTTTDSTNGFVINDSGGSSLLTVDTFSKRVYAGNPVADGTGVVLVLDSKNTAGDPTGVAGGIYYSQFLAKFRCYENGFWRDCIETPRSGFTYTNDFMGVTTDGNLTFAVTGSGAANSATAVSSVAGRPGVMQHTTGTTATGSARAVSTGVDGILLGNDTNWRFEAGARILTLSSSVERFTYRTGFLDSGTSSPVDGCFYRYSDNLASGNWQGVCRANNTESACDTGVAVVAGTWYRLTLQVNSAGTSVDFMTDGTSRCQITTNIPTGAGRGTAFGSSIIKSVGTTARTAALDYLYVRGEFTTANR